MTSASMAAPCLVLNLFYDADQDHDHHRYHNGQRHHNDGDDHHHYEGDMANKIKKYIYEGGWRQKAPLLIH